MSKFLSMTDSQLRREYARFDQGLTMEEVAKRIEELQAKIDSLPEGDLDTLEYYSDELYRMEEQHTIMDLLELHD